MPRFRSSGRADASSASATEMKPWPPSEAVVSVPWPRNERGATAGLKTISYGENVRALAVAKEAGAGEAIFANTVGDLCEGTGTNVFVAGTDSLRWPAWTVVERSGARIAILGLTTPGSAIWDRHHVEGKLEFRRRIEQLHELFPRCESELTGRVQQ